MAGSISHSPLVTHPEVFVGQGSGAVSPNPTSGCHRGVKHLATQLHSRGMSSRIRTIEVSMSPVEASRVPMSGNHQTINFLRSSVPRSSHTRASAFMQADDIHTPSFGPLGPTCSRCSFLALLYAVGWCRCDADSSAEHHGYDIIWKHLPARTESPN